MTLPKWVFGSAQAKSLWFWTLTLLGAATSIAKVWDGGLESWVFFSAWAVNAFTWASIEDDEIVVVEVA